MRIEINPDGIWYHGSNTMFGTLREGSTVTQWRISPGFFSSAIKVRL